MPVKYIGDTVSNLNDLMQEVHHASGNPTPMHDLPWVGPVLYYGLLENV